MVQCKRYINPVGVVAIRDLYGALMAERVGKGIVITSSGFTREAIAFASDKPIELIDRTKLWTLLCSFGMVESRRAKNPRSTPRRPGGEDAHPHLRTP